MKKIVFILLSVCIASVTFADPGVNEKVLKVFNDAFPSVQNARWHDYETYYEVYFEKDDMKCRIKYDQDGNVIGTRRDYYETHLSPFIKAKVTKKYFGKKIFGVTEMTSDSEMYYIITLEDEKSWTQLKADATGQMSVVEKLKKSDK